METTYRILVYGQDKIPLGSRLWSEEAIKELLKKTKEETPDVFVYSRLRPGIELNVAKIAQDLEIPVIGCIPYDKFIWKEDAYTKKLFNQVSEKLFSLKIIDRAPSYETYRKQDLYLIHQANYAICVWDEQEDHTRIFTSVLASKWKSTDQEVYIVNFAKNHIRSILC